MPGAPTGPPGFGQSFGHPLGPPFRDPFFGCGPLGAGGPFGAGGPLGAGDWSIGGGPFNWRKMMRDRKWGCGPGGVGLGMGVGASGCPWMNPPPTGDGWKDKERTAAEQEEENRRNNNNANAAKKDPADREQAERDGNHDGGASNGGARGKGVISQHAEYTDVHMSGIATLVSAQYGTNGTFTDVTALVRSQMTPHGTLSIEVTNDTMGGDPCPGLPKKLILHYEEKPEIDRKPAGTWGDG